MQEHLTKDHDMDVTISTHNFCDMEEFEKWKTAEETASRSYFVRNSSSKLYGDTNKFYYYYKEFIIYRRERVSSFNSLTEVTAL